jgi:hypothetical protein
VSTLMNVYREIYASKKSLLAATTNLSWLRIHSSCRS